MPMSSLKVLQLLLLLLFLPVITKAEDKVPPKFYDGLPAEIKKNSHYHIVKQNESLSVIAAHYGYNYAELAQWNDIPPPYSVTVGQQLKLFNEKTTNVPQNIPGTPKQAALLEKSMEQATETARRKKPLPTSADLEINDPVFDATDRAFVKNYVVKKNESLSSIALRFKVLPAQLAAWNDITSLDQVQAGHKLKIFNKKQHLTYLNSSKITEKITGNLRDNSQKTSIISINNKSMLKLYRQWPTEGKIIKKFSQTNGRGIEISGTAGQAIKAIAPGKVVAVSPGIYGHGGFIVIQHDNQYLSSYTNNRRSLVKNGQMVTEGQVIAEMGRVGRKPPSLEFEIRKNGTLVDPMWLLPKKI